MNPESFNSFESWETKKMALSRMAIPSGSGYGPPKPPKKEKRKLFDNIEYKRTARVRRDAWFMRLWSWAWDTPVENADFCKLWWGMVFMPLNFFLRVVLVPI